METDKPPRTHRSGQIQPHFFGRHRGTLAHPGERRVRPASLAAQAARAKLPSVPARLNPESPGVKRLVEIAREFEPVHLVARRTLLFGDVWLEPGERFHCAKRMAAALIDDGLAERVVSPS
jgi:hypothetical protein